MRWRLKTKKQKRSDLFTFIIIIFLCSFDFFPQVGQADFEDSPDLSQRISQGQDARLILTLPDDPYMSLAEKISHEENIPIVHSIQEVLAANPEILIWIASPQHLSMDVLTQYGVAVKDNKRTISLGIISGNTIDKAGELWRRKIDASASLVSVVPREDHINIITGDLQSSLPLNKENVISTLPKSSYVFFGGHGAGRHWRLEDDILLEKKDVPNLPASVVMADSCQTFQPWKEDSIALAFTDQGAAAYAGYLNTPFGYEMGEPHSFPLRFTWPGFSIGHVIQVLNHDMQQGFLAWPFYFLLGNPSLSFRDTPPYEIIESHTLPDGMVMTYSGAPQGMIPVRIAGGAGFNFIEIPGVGKAWMGDLFFNQFIQMVDIGMDKFILFKHAGGDFRVELSRQPAWYWPAWQAISVALDHTTIIYHAEADTGLNLVFAVLVLAVCLILLRKKKLTRSILPAALLVGAIFTLLRGGYAFFRQTELINMYENYLRTQDLAFEISLLFLFGTFIWSTAAVWMFLSLQKWWAKALAFLVALFPGWFIALFWLGSLGVINYLANQQYGYPLYAYGGAWAPSIVGVLEGLFLGAIIRLAHLRRIKRYHHGGTEKEEVRGDDEERGINHGSTQQ